MKNTHAPSAILDRVAVVLCTCSRCAMRYITFSRSGDMNCPHCSKPNHDGEWYVLHGLTPEKQAA